MDLIIKNITSSSDLKFFTKIAKGLGFTAAQLSLEEREDFILAKLIDEGMKEKGEIPVEKFNAFLKKKIASSR